MLNNRCYRFHVVRRTCADPYRQLYGTYDVRIDEILIMKVPVIKVRLILNYKSYYFFLKKTPRLLS